MSEIDEIQFRSKYTSNVLFRLCLVSLDVLWMSTVVCCGGTFSFQTLGNWYCWIGIAVNGERRKEIEVNVRRYDWSVIASPDSYNNYCRKDTRN